MTAGLFASEKHPEACPWCGRSGIRGIVPSPDGNRWYRCVACATTFFLRVASHRGDREGREVRAAADAAGEAAGRS